MHAEDKVFKEMFGSRDLILIGDVNGKILYYEDYNDRINMLRYENAVGHSIFELYPFFKREDLTFFKAIDTKRMIVNRVQHFEVGGIPKKTLTSAYPLINETGLIGCMLMSIELDNRDGKKKLSSVSSKYNFEDILTQNEGFGRSFDTLRLLARGDANILIYGETGTGKELIAHTIHANSPRSMRPFIIQNCAAIPGNLIESILFGSAKGSFTGAVDKAGLFELAESGTLFLDEVNSMSLELQGKLLRAIESKSIRRVGESFERETDVRIITSTNEHLADMVQQGRFRKDLYYRLNVASFSIPPLRERRDDISLLCSHYIKYYNAMFNHKIAGLDDSLKEFFLQYSWDGNVRELKNVIEYACTIKASGKIGLSHIPEDMLRRKQPMDSAAFALPAADASVERVDYVCPGRSLADQVSALEKDILEAAIQRNRYSITRTARELKLARQTLYNKLKKYGILD